MIEIAGFKFYTIMETAKLMGISIPTVRQYIKQGRLKAKRVGRPYLIQVEHVKEFLQNSDAANLIK